MNANAGAATGQGEVRGRRVLIVEDESMVIMLMEDFLAELGCEIVAVASRLKEAHDKASRLTFDLAVLDVNLNGEQTFALARELLAAGRAIVFSTGYGAGTLPLELRHVPILQKPFQQEDLERALRAALALRAAAAPMREVEPQS
jgi:CheY-like chemotaxis protein